MKRCFGDGKDFYEEYHDKEWGIPVYEDRALFEMLTLEGAQAGLSWETILKRRDGYKKLFHNFDPKLVAGMLDVELEKILLSENVIRNRLKIFSVPKNAKVFLSIQEEFGSFANYIWAFVDHKTIKNNPKDFSSIPSKTEISDKISKDLKRRGMSFVGSTIIYAFMQAIGMVDDHLTCCHKNL
jgi:DNA-3-methyladenine glycosylase I